MRICRGAFTAAMICAVSFGSESLGADTGDRVDFDRDIRPILSDKCFRCHGPDAAARESELRLDLRDDALGPAASGEVAIVPGKPEASGLVARISSTDAAEVMPPPEINKALNESEKSLLRRWIAEGAEYRRHWSLVAPTRRDVPRAGNGSAVRNDVDRFILARLAAEGSEPSPEADRVTLIRRVTLDLTGLPPTPEEVDAFLADDSPDAYEKVVDRLLSSPHYGERMALDWLDAARYADTHGYHIDSGRDMTRWREWVIDAFAANMPYDRFTIEQLAGDLLPEPTVEQRVASGFNRNHMINFEGGAIPEEYHTAYIIDRVNTTATVWLGLTVACAQCHDHKYDPISQKDYYGLFAFFHNVPEKGLDGVAGNAAPVLKLPTPAQQAEGDRLRAEIARLEKELDRDDEGLDHAQAEWEGSFAPIDTRLWSTVTGDPQRCMVMSEGGATVTRLEDGSVRFSGTNPDADTYAVAFRVDRASIAGLRLDVLSDEGLAEGGPGRSANGNMVLTDVRVEYAVAEGGAAKAAVKSASADFAQKDFEVRKAIDGDPASGWAIHPETGKPHWAVFELERKIENDGPVLVTVRFDFLSPFGRHQPGRIRLSITESEKAPTYDGVPDNVRKSLKVAAAERSDVDRLELRRYFRSNIAAATKTYGEKLKDLRDRLAKIDETVATAMVMQEMTSPRDTYVLVRGEYDKKGDKVVPAVPAALPALPSGSRTDRLGLAEWLVSPSHPLTARVAVNRYWQMFFGTGLVKTADDFGSQGEAPSDPELLDWLAIEFRESGWDVKALVKLVVMSGTYRQSSSVTPESLATDPENRLLARGPRFRLPAEFIRDQALAASGLLNARVGGESVSPYQPPGLWEELMSREDGARFTAQAYSQSHGADLYRRTMYTFWKRTCPPPTLATFDAPDREICTVRRARTNTPLQALVLLNDPTYVEASRKLAERVLAGPEQTTEGKLTATFRLVTARRPRGQELSILAEMLSAQREKYRRNPAAAEQLLSVGESPRDPRFEAPELAAWATIAAAILNLDETVTRQ